MKEMEDTEGTGSQRSNGEAETNGTPVTALRAAWIEQGRDDKPPVDQEWLVVTPLLDPYAGRRPASPALRINV